MSAEQAPQPAEADQQEPLRPQAGQPFRLATEGAFSGQNSLLSPNSDEFLLPTQYEARLGGTAAGQPPRRQSGDVAHDDQEPRGRNRLQNIVVGSGITTLVGAIVLGTAALLNKGGNSEPNQDLDTGVGGEVTQSDPVEKPSLTPTEASRPTEVPRKYPEKYNFGEGDKYFHSYEDGKIWTGVEADRAEKDNITFDFYIGSRDTATIKEFSTELGEVGGIEFSDSKAVMKAILVSEEMRKKGGGSDGKYTREDVEEAISKVESAMSQSNFSKEKKFGVAFTFNPTNQAYGTQFLGYGKYEDEGNIVFQLFSPQSSIDVPGQAWGHVMEMITMNALGLLETNTPYFIGHDSEMREKINEIGVSFIPLVPRDSIKYTP